MKILSWNVNGLRSMLKKTHIYNELNFNEFIDYNNADIVCFSEIKLTCNQDFIFEETFKDYPYKYWSHCSKQAGRHGVAVLSKYEPLNVEYESEDIFDGRYVQLEFKEFFLVSVYVPNSGKNFENLELRTQKWDVAIQNKLNKLKNIKEVIYTGDMNVVNLERDTHNFKQHRNKLAGVHDAERLNFFLLLQSGFLNVYRELHPRKTAYTYFTYLFNARKNYKGMFIDYFLVTPKLMCKIKEMNVLDDVIGSDHAPIELLIDLNLSHNTNMKDKIIEDLTIISNKEARSENYFKVRAYQKVINQLKELDKIENMNDVKNVEGIGDRIYSKIQEILEKGYLQSAVDAQESDFFQRLSAIHGIGSSGARKLIDDYNIQSIEELKKKVITNPEILNEQQKIGLKYYEDLNMRIPREEMDKHADYIHKKLSPLKLKYDITGSYRRGSEDSGDIDLLIESTDPKILAKIIKIFDKDHYIKENLSIGQRKYMGIVKLPNKPVRRVDILVATPEEYPFSLLYFTGDKYRNIQLRRKAGEKNMKLNEKGLIDLKTGKGIKLKSEQEIIDYINNL